MKASVNLRYGSPDVLEIRNIPRPNPEESELLVKVHAATVGRTDACALRAHPFFMRPHSGLLRPKHTVLGVAFAGTVEAAGQRVTRFEPGDRVFGIAPGGHGAHAEYVCVPQDGTVAVMPPDARFDEAAVCEGAWYADTYLRKFELKPGHRILIYGASGAIGTSAVQLAKYYGAYVTAVVSARHVELAKKLGADRVVDYQAEDFTRLGEDFDFVLDAVGKTSYFKCRHLLKPTGVFSATDLGPGWSNVALALWSSVTRSGRVVMPMPRPSQTFVEFLRDRVRAGEFRAVVDRKYPFHDIASAYRYVDTEQKVGIVVIDVVVDRESVDRGPVDR